MLLLDTWALLTRADLRAGEEALRRWLAAAALARPAGAGGRVVVVADGGAGRRCRRCCAGTRPGSPRGSWPSGASWASRRRRGWPALTGPADAVADLLAAARLPDGAEVLGPVPAERRARSGCWCGCPARRAAALAEALHAAAGVRSARKAADPVRIQVDPLTLF